MGRPLEVWNLRAGKLEKVLDPRNALMSSPDEEQILCFLCGHTITSVSERISMSGSHEHYFQNPAGIHFHVGCFRQAPGVNGSGGATEEHTWFPGFAWSFCTCAQCRVHLGWKYIRDGSAPFFGLILDRLILPD